jgi:hypothetical protein
MPVQKEQGEVLAALQQVQEGIERLHLLGLRVRPNRVRRFSRRTKAPCRCRLIDGRYNPCRDSVMAAHMMEVYAAAISHYDYQMAR